MPRWVHLASQAAPPCPERPSYHSPPRSAAVPQAAAWLGSRHWRPVPLHNPRRAFLLQRPADSPQIMYFRLTGVRSRPGAIGDRSPRGRSVELDPPARPLWCRKFQ